MVPVGSVAVVLAALGGAPDGILLDFSASWCAPCRSMEPIVHRLQMQGYAIRKVDIDREPALAKRFHVTQIPTFVLLIRGQERQRHTGTLSEAQLRRMVAMIPPKQDGNPHPRPPVAKPKKPEVLLVVNDDDRNGRHSGSERPIDAETPLPSVIRANLSDAPAAPLASDSLHAAARIRVRDSNGMDVGSGTVIHSEAGRTIILTCGHIFRHFTSDGEINVDIFRDERYQSFEGKLLDHDLDADIGLVSVPTLKPVPYVEVSARNVETGNHVFSVGCGGGDPPTKLQHLVTSTTKYRDFLECTGTPVQGRSGGALFTESGQVAGVCVFADPAARRGLYAPLRSIRMILDRSGMNWIYRRTQAEADESKTDQTEERVDLEELPPFEAEEKVAAAEPDPPEPNSERKAPDSSGSELAELGNLIPVVDDRAFQNSGEKPAARNPVVGPNVESLQAALDSAPGAEVVCIIRDHRYPEAPSRVVIIHKATRQFIADLTGQLENQVHATSMTRSKPRAVDAAKANAPAMNLRQPTRSTGPRLQRYTRKR